MPDTTLLHIKNMVCDRCRMAVEQALRDAGLHPVSVELGVAIVEGKPSDDTMAVLSGKLDQLGFQLLSDRRQQTVERIRTAIVEIVHHQATLGNAKLSDHISQLLHSDYSALSKLFSECTGTTIERYYILQRVERAKELLSWGELTLSAIANELGYSSTAHLSSQFKAVTGMTPTQYRNDGGRGLTPIDQL